MAGDSSLKAVSDNFRVEVEEIRQAFDSSASCDHVTRYSMRYAPHVDGCVVSLWDAWNRMLRALVLTSAAGPVVGISGNRYVPQTARGEAHALQHLLHNKNQLGIKLIAGEPNWYNIAHLSSITSGLGLSNASQIVAAVSASSITLGSPGSIGNPIEDIRIVRNFIAHKTKALDYQVRSLAHFGATGNVHKYLWDKTSGGAERFYIWTSALCVIAEACCN